MSEVTVRQYNSEDFEGLIRLLGEVYDSHVSQEVLEKNYLGDNKMIFVAENEGNIIGCSFLEICRDYIREYTYGYVTYVAVDKTLRKMGTGSKLMKSMEETARERGCTAIELTSANYRKEAHAFYDALGFTVKKTTVFIKELY